MPTAHQSSILDQRNYVFLWRECLWVDGQLLLDGIK